MRFSPPWAAARCYRVCNHAFSPFHEITPTRCLKKRMGKLMTTMKYLHFSRAGKKTMNKRCDNLNYLVELRARRQLLLERELLGSPAVSGWLEKWQVTRTTFFFLMLYRPTEAQLKRQIAGAISYGGRNLSAFKLVPLQRLDPGVKISRAADKGMQTDICQSARRPTARSSLFSVV